MIGLLIHDLAQPHFQTEYQTQFETVRQRVNSNGKCLVLVMGEDIGVLRLFLY
ncbi:hypothetical protein E2C01_034377 [Portunus trituberculatus]|uniref:Uncharacterized protein n=1 Tax=Portunus trituberculatus TaxID=210409 RepID=A0A5B7F6U0_PORTR|nr:hypothetical protein [Portunus trituberculatus]